MTQAFKTACILKNYFTYIRHGVARKLILIIAKFRIASQHYRRFLTFMRSELSALQTLFAFNYKVVILADGATGSSSLLKPLRR